MMMMASEAIKTRFLMDHSFGELSYENLCISSVKLRTFPNVWPLLLFFGFSISPAKHVYIIEA
jgi:hypothetical protein